MEMKLTQEQKEMRERTHNNIKARYEFDINQATIMCMFFDRRVLQLDIRRRQYNDLKKGDRVVMLPINGISDNTRTGVIMENKRGGITRMVKIDETHGYFGDIGSVYLDEIVAYIDEEGKYYVLKPTDTERKNMAKTREMANTLFGEV